MLEGMQWQRPACRQATIIGAFCHKTCQSLWRVLDWRARLDGVHALPDLQEAGLALAAHELQAAADVHLESLNPLVQHHAWHAAFYHAPGACDQALSS